jgi:DNA-binding NtrC family response regulator
MTRPHKPFDPEVTVSLGGALEVVGGSVHPDSQPKRRVPIAGEPVLIGRDAACTLVLDDGRVSSVHGELVGTERGVRLRDLGSKNGTFIGGVRVGEVYLTSRTTFRVGDTECTFEPLSSGPVVVDEGSRFGPLVGETTQMRALFGRLAKVAATDLTVLIGGETGTGKELLARAIHDGSKRASGPFVVVDCGSIPATLAEATLFGHERGAFTGAVDRRASPFVEADGGTIFLDELGELPVELQPKLLRALAERRIKSVGGSTYRAVDVRVVAATRRDLVRDVNDGNFRSDLFFRVAEVRLDLPALRDRLDDIPLIVAQILTDLGDAAAIRRVPREVIGRLMRHDWPGNVRELRNAVAVALALSDGGPLDIGAQLGALGVREPSRSQAQAAESTPTGIFRDAKQSALTRFERAYFGALVAETGGNVSEIARRAGIERAHVRTYLRRHGLLPSRE